VGVVAVKDDKMTRGQGDKVRQDEPVSDHLVTLSPGHPVIRPGVFLDRDGVINRTFVREGVPHPPATVEELEILPGVTDALRRLHAMGLPLIVVTNQPDVARGTQTRAEVERMNDRLRQILPLTAIYVCYHDDAEGCDCRKPKPGMLLRAAAEHVIDLSRSWMVGDRWGDVAAGAAAGCKTVLIELTYSQGHRCTPDARVADLSEAVERIVRRLR
jgi:D-glycero-D-manno-heptose 1,7-bisphosphate phosphatase